MKTLFPQLAENIPGSLHVSSCYVDERANVRDQWPGEAKHLMPQDNLTFTNSFPKQTPQVQASGS